MKYDLNRLRIFHHIYLLSSVSEAAQALNLSQPAVSQHLKKLEKEIKIPLFTRVHKKMVPTAAGHKLHEVIHPFLTSLPGVLQNLRDPADKPYGLLRVGAPYEFGQVYLPELCHTFRELYPEVRFSIRLGEPLTLLRLLREGELDFAVIDLVLAAMHQMETQAGYYAIDPLVDEELTLICSREYYDREIRGDHSVNHLLEKDFISDEHDDMFLKHWFLHHFQKRDVQPQVVVTVESHQANLRCVKLGMGLTTTSSHMVWKEIDSGSIVPITTQTPNAINTISLVELQDRVPTLTETVFHQHLVQTMQQDNMLRRFSSLPMTTEAG